MKKHYVLFLLFGLAFQLGFSQWNLGGNNNVLGPIQEKLGHEFPGS